jgi:peroxiredoxin
MLRMLPLAAIAFFTFALPALAEPEIGAPAPDFTVSDIKGKEQSSSKHKGKIIVLEWNNPGCPFVNKFYNFGEMQRLQKANVKNGVVWLTINSGAEGKQGHMSKEEARKQAAEWGIASAYILDPKGEIGRAYGAKTTPHMYVIDKEGKLAYMGAIDDKPSSDAKDIPNAKNYVTAAIEALSAGKPVETSSTTAYGCAVKYAD